MMMNIQLVLLALVCGSGVFIQSTQGSDVLTLTKDNFDQAIADNSVVIVKFYAPWCGHCKSLAPIWEEVATSLKDKEIAVAKVDVTVEEALGKQFEIKGFPTLKFFKNGEFAADYNGGRTAEAISSFLIKKSGDPYKVLSSYADAEALLAGEKNGIVIGYFTSFDSEEFNEFKKAADKSDTIKYYVISDASSANDCELSAEGQVMVLTQSGEKIQYVPNKEVTLETFVERNAFPQSMDLDPELFQAFLKKSVIVVAAHDANAKDSAAFVAMATEQVKGHAVKQMFADSNKWGQALVRMGVVSGNVYPTFVAFDGRTEKAGPISWDEAVEVTPEAYSAWVAGVLAGTQGTWKKSEPVPEDNAGALTVVVASEFEKLVLDSAKDALVMFYAPWCGHCKNLMPVYEAVAEKFADDNTVIIAKMDATANYVDPSYGVQGFPTLKFFPAGSNDVLDYEGDRTGEDFIEFINTNRNTQA